jgi:serine/threonine protein kinase
LNVAPQRTRHLAPGDKLGKYEVIRQIAIGGMAELYLARTLGIEGFEKLVVLKRILPQYVSNATFVNMFLNEARLAATLHHPNIAQVYDIGLEEGDYFFAMEYVHGEDLDHISIASEEQGVPLSMDAGLTLVAGLCAGLHYAHEKMNAEGKPLHIVHRDVSPSNVLVSYDGAVKLVDFGIARASSRPGTTQGGLKGKIAYMSPEQCRAKAQLDRRSDLYSVGAILYELTTGQLPFTGETEYQVLNQIVNEDVPPPSSVVPGYPEHLERIVLKALARDVDQRYATALELQADVEDFAHESRLRVSPLVLARIMGTLFPARLEEWDHAKAQGAFFVEQHVVRTLIESGKTPDPSDPETVAQLAAIAEAQARQDAAVLAAEAAIRQFSDDDPTALGQAFDTSDTTVGDSPMEGAFAGASETSVEPLPPTPTEEGRAYDQPTTVQARKYTPTSGQPTAHEPIEYSDGHVDVPAPPDPRPPQAYPIVSELATATPGALVTASTKYGGPVIQPRSTADDSARMRVPPRRHTSPTTFVRTPSRTPIYAVIGLLAAGLGVAAFFVFGTGGDTPSSASLPAEEPVRMPVQATPPPPQQPASFGPAPALPPAAEVKVAEPAPKPQVAKPQVTKPQVAKPQVAKPQVAASEPVAPKKMTKVEPKKLSDVKPAAKPTEQAKKVAPAPKKPEPKKTEAKETSWNADSPFMPVRTDKK